MKNLPAFLLLLLSVATVVAQRPNYIKGKVTHGETGVGIPNASVFITNTSKGTTSNAAGEFELLNVPEGNYDLVVSSIGFETLVYSYKAAELPLQLKAQLKPKAQELQTVVVEPFEKDGWEKWGKFFTESFVGTSSFAGRCTITNYKTLRFRHSKKKNILTVISTEPLIIENKALGYKIQYQLEEFSYDFKQGMLMYFGYTLFDELNDAPAKKKQLENREKSYYGSIVHFMSSIYHNRLAEEGFAVKRLVKTPNLEKQRVKQIMMRPVNKQQNFNDKNLRIMIGGDGDSSAYYQRILKQPDMLETYGDSLLTADSLLVKGDSTYKRIYFTDYLYVVYKGEKEDAEYLQYTHEARDPYYQRSVVYLINNTPLVIDAMGNYSMPQGLISYGYWSWSEKIATLLPLDYKKEIKFK